MLKFGWSTLCMYAHAMTIWFLDSLFNRMADLANDEDHIYRLSHTFSVEVISCCTLGCAFRGEMERIRLMGDVGGGHPGLGVF